MVYSQKKTLAEDTLYTYKLMRKTIYLEYQEVQNVWGQLLRSPRAAESWQSQEPEEFH